MKTKKRHVRWSREDCSREGRSSTGLQPTRRAQQSPLGALLLLLARVSPAQDDLILSLSLCVCCQSTRKILWKSQDTLARIFFVNAATNRTVPSWRDPQSLEMLRSNVNQARIQQRIHIILRAVGWPLAIVSVTGSPTSCHWEESRQDDSVMSVYGQVDRAIVIAGRSITSYEGQLNNTTFRSIRKTHACHKWWLTDIYYCIWDIIHQNCIKRTTSVHCFENRQIRNMLSLLTDGPTAWHHANRWLNPMLLNQGTASNTMLSDWTQVD